MMLLDGIIFNGKMIGQVSEEGIEWGGEKAQYISLYSAQKRKAALKKIKKKDATNVFNYNIIELLPDNCAAVMGGEVIGTKWKAPDSSVTLEGELIILCGTGQTIRIARASLDAVIRGKLGGDDPLFIEVEQEMLEPLGGGSPYEIDDTVPFIDADIKSLSFAAAGEAKKLEVSASGMFYASEVPTGFSVKVVNGHITVTAEANTGAARSGNLVFALRADATKKVTITLSQAKAST
jgi:hypothetical protein